MVQSGLFCVNFIAKNYAFFICLIFCLVDIENDSEIDIFSLHFIWLILGCFYVDFFSNKLGDRYIYAGDRGHSWRGSNDLRPYVCSVLEKEEYYSKRLKLDNSCWENRDIITVDLNLGSGKENDNSRRTITFYKNGKKLHRSITVEKKCKYYPVFQVYQRGQFEIIHEGDIGAEGIEFESSDDEDDNPAAKGMDRPDLPDIPQIMIRTKSLDSDDED